MKTTLGLMSVAVALAVGSGAALAQRHGDGRAGASAGSRGDGARMAASGGWRGSGASSRSNGDRGNRGDWSGNRGTSTANRGDWSGNRGHGSGNRGNWSGHGNRWSGDGRHGGWHAGGYGHRHGGHYHGYRRWGGGPYYYPFSLSVYALPTYPIYAAPAPVYVERYAEPVYVEPSPPVYAPPPVAAAPEPPPPRPMDDPPPERLERYTLSATELFEFDRAVLRMPQPKLDEIAATLNRNPQINNVTITGYTDRIGTDSYNLKLSQRRADAVKNYLVGKGVSPIRLTAIGKGKANPVVQCNEKTQPALIKCLEPNRRVEVEQITVERRLR